MNGIFKIIDFKTKVSCRELEQRTDTDREMARRVLDQLFKGKKPTSVNDPAMVTFNELLTDIHFRHVGTRTAGLIAKRNPSPVYEYVYVHEGTMTLTDLLTTPPWKFLLRVRPQFKRKEIGGLFLLPYIYLGTFILKLNMFPLIKSLLPSR